MARTLDIALVIDVESTCWKDRPPVDQVGEIIEIGLCTFDVESLARIEKRSILVKPSRSEVSEFCTELTTLTPADVADGMDFREACRLLRAEYNSRERLFVSYGDYDRRQFERQCRELEVAYPFGPTHLNVKNLAALALGWPREDGMPAALAAFDLPLEGTHHRGHDDAWNIAAVLGAVLGRARAAAG